MKYTASLKVGTPLLFVPVNEIAHHESLTQSIGMIVEIDKNSRYPYRIIFDDGDDDWYSNESGFIDSMVEQFNKVFNE